MLADVQKVHCKDLIGNISAVAGGVPWETGAEVQCRTWGIYWGVLLGSSPVETRQRQSVGLGSRRRWARCCPREGSANSMGHSGTWRGPSELSWVGARGQAFAPPCWSVMDVATSGRHVTWREAVFCILHRGLTAEGPLPAAFPDLGEWGLPSWREFEWLIAVPTTRPGDWEES